MRSCKSYHINYEILQKLYVSDGLSAILIANKLNVPKDSIYRRLKKYGLTRSSSEAGKNKFVNFPRLKNFDRLHTKEVIMKAQETRKRRYGNNPPWVSVEAQAKRSESLKRFYVEHPERKDKARIQFIKNVIDSGKHRSGHPIGSYITTDEIRGKIRITVNKNYKEHPEIIEKIRKARSKQVFPTKESSIERTLQGGLEDAGIIFEKHHHLYSEGCATIIDIAFPNKKIAVYCDGDYWHNLPSYIKRDKHTNEALKQAGWLVLRFWEHEIKDNLKYCVEQISIEVNKKLK